MKKKCPNCKLVNFEHSTECGRCKCDLVEVASISGKGDEPIISKILKRVGVFTVVCVFAILGFYLSMIFTSDPLKPAERQSIKKAVAILDEKGFSREVFLLNYLTSFRANDHWLNASVVKENAYAATNYPFEIMTIYPDFFQHSIDDVERAAMLLHESKHLEGMEEKAAYEYVWKNRAKLGWTEETYSNSLIWNNVRKQTKEFAPELFVCDFNEFGDCTAS
jgi:hypothetical protein